MAQIKTLSYAAEDRVKRILNPESISFESILKDLETDLLSRPDGQSWSSRFNGGVGTTLMEWMAAILGEAKTSALLASRESSIQTSRTIDNVIRLAAQLGYIYNRSTAARFNLTVTSTTPVLLPTGTKIGTTPQGLLYTLEDKNLVVGENVIEVTAGTLMTSPEKTADSTDQFAGITYTATELSVPSITEIDHSHLRLIVNGQLQQYTLYPEKMGEDGNDFLIRQGYSELEIVCGAGESYGKLWAVGDKVVLEYVKVDETVSLSISSISLNYPGIVITHVGLKSPRKNTDSLRKISMLAPGFHNSRNSAVTKRDYEVLLNAFPGIESAKWYPGRCVDLQGNTIDDGIHNTAVKCGLSTGTWEPSIDNLECCSAPLVYLFDDEHAITDQEKLDIYDYFDDLQFAGTSITFIDPVVRTLDISVDVYVIPGITENLVLAALNNLVENQCKILGHNYSPSLIVRGLDQLNGISETYIRVNDAEIQALPNEYFKAGEVSVTLRSVTSNTLSKFGQ